MKYSNEFLLAIVLFTVGLVLSKSKIIAEIRSAKRAPSPTKKRKGNSNRKKEGKDLVPPARKREYREYPYAIAVSFGAATVAIVALIPSNSAMKADLDATQLEVRAIRGAIQHAAETMLDLQMAETHARLARELWIDFQLLDAPASEGARLRREILGHAWNCSDIVEGMHSKHALRDLLTNTASEAMSFAAAYPPLAGLGAFDPHDDIPISIQDTGEIVECLDDALENVRSQAILELLNARGLHPVSLDAQVD